RDPIGSGLYYQGAFTKNAELAAFRTLTKGECSQYKDQFNLTKVSEWISNEIIHQFYNDFKSLKFINLLLTFPKERFLKIKITNSSDESLPRQLRLDPLLLVMIKKPCLPEEEFDKLYQTFTGLERGGYNYSDSFEYKTEDEIEKCYQEKKGEVCNP